MPKHKGGRENRNFGILSSGSQKIGGCPDFFFSPTVRTCVLSEGVGWVLADGLEMTVSPDRVPQLYQWDPLLIL